MTRTTRYLLVLLAAAALGAGAYAFAQVRPLPVELAGIESDVAIQVFGLGTVEARIRSDVGFEVGAALVEIDADHGDRVPQGAVLAKLHRAEQEARLAQAEAGVKQAEAALNNAAATVTRAQAVLAQRQQTNRRRQELAKRGTVSVEAAEEAQMEADVAAADVALALSGVEVARAALEDARARARTEAALLDHHTLGSPYDAVVVARHKELGTVLAPGEPLFTLMDPESVWTLAHVDEASAGDIRVGQPAEVRLRSLPRQVFRGRVARIDIESDRVSEERRVHVACEPCPEAVYLGEQAEVLITTGRLARALLVPETAVEGFTGTGGTVWTVESGRLHRRAVEFGHRTLDARLEIIGGLPVEADVVTRLRGGLREGRAATESAAP